MKLKINNRDKRYTEFVTFLVENSLILKHDNMVRIAKYYAKYLYKENIKHKEHPPEIMSSQYVSRHLTMLDRSLRSINLYATIENIKIDLGYVYLVTNEHFPGFTKIGSARDAETRLIQYQTGSPYRDYKLDSYSLVPGYREAEKLFLKEFASTNEWSSIPTEVLRNHLKRFKKSYTNTYYFINNTKGNPNVR